MENVSYVDKFVTAHRNTPVFQQKNGIYTHGQENPVDNVEKFTHMKKSSKIRAWTNVKKIMHNVYIKLYTIYPQNVDNF